MTITRDLKRQLCTITKSPQGYILHKPVHKGMVLSGGGAKGIAYVGMIQAMEHHGLLKNLTHVSGASAGAMTASLLAVGMSTENIETLVNQLDLLKILDKDSLSLRAKGHWFRNLFEMIYVLQLKEHFLKIELPLSTGEDRYSYALLQHKINMYEGALIEHNLDIRTLNDLIEMTDSVEKLILLDEALAAIPKQLQSGSGQIENAKITFSDLARLRQLLPEDEQHLIKSLAVVTTNQTHGILDVYSEMDHSDASIAEKVQQSGAHPLLFVPSLNDLNESIADGGILDNMPVGTLLHAGLHKEEILGVDIESDDVFAERVRNAQIHAAESPSYFLSVLDELAKLWLGAYHLSGLAEIINREKVMYHLDNMLYLNSGSITTTTISPTAEQKQEAIAAAFLQTEAFLAEQTKTFDNALIAMLYLGKKELEKIIIDEEMENDLHWAALQAQFIFFMQDTIVGEINRDIYGSVIHFIIQIEQALDDFNMEKEQKDDAMALCLKQINHFTEGRLEHYIIDQLITHQESLESNWFIQCLEWLYRLIDEILVNIISPFASSPAELEPDSAESAIENGQNGIESQIKEDIMETPDPKLVRLMRINALFTYKKEIIGIRNEFGEEENQHTSNPLQL